jgi:hypothetical protein
VHLGPLVFSLQIGENWEAIAGAKGLAEWHVSARGSWNYAVELSSSLNWAVRRHPIGRVPFASESAAVVIVARGAQVRSWLKDGAQSGPIPNGPVRDRGPMTDLLLVPYGNARIRVTEFPTTVEQLSRNEQGS